VLPPCHSLNAAITPEHFCGTARARLFFCSRSRVFLAIFRQMACLLSRQKQTAVNTGRHGLTLPTSPHLAWPPRADFWQEFSVDRRKIC
jgi:hypothetical protein